MGVKMNQEFAALLAPWVPAAAKIAAVSFVTFIVLLGFVGRRRFYRKEFKSYGAAVGVGLMEDVVDFIGRVFAAICFVSLVVVVLWFVFARL